MNIKPISSVGIIHVKPISNARTPIKVDVPKSPVLIGDIYTGEYEVTPSVKEAITLKTNTKTLTNDVTVNKIPYYETSNQYGKSIIIGEV